MSKRSTKRRKLAAQLRHKTRSGVRFCREAYIAGSVSGDVFHQSGNRKRNLLNMRVKTLRRMVNAEWKPNDPASALELLGAVLS